MTRTAYQMASRFLGLSEVAGQVDNPAILAMLQLDSPWVTHDEVAWCSGFVNYISWLWDLPRSKSLAARSNLKVGRPITLAEARPGWDIVILSRGAGPQPPATVLDAPGHVGFFSAYDPVANTVTLLGGNQGNKVSLAPFPALQVLGVRRLLED